MLALQFIAQNKRISNYMAVLELLLRLRQCCDHPFLVLSAPSKDVDTVGDMEKVS